MIKNKMEGISSATTTRTQESSETAMQQQLQDERSCGGFNFGRFTFGNANRFDGGGFGGGGFGGGGFNFGNEASFRDGYTSQRRFGQRNANGGGRQCC